MSHCSDVLCVIVYTCVCVWSTVLTLILQLQSISFLLDNTTSGVCNDSNTGEQDH